jgi:hypothetical protein
LADDPSDCKAGLTAVGRVKHFHGERPGLTDIREFGPAQHGGSVRFWPLQGQSTGVNLGGPCSASDFTRSVRVFEPSLAAPYGCPKNPGGARGGT